MRGSEQFFSPFHLIDAPNGHIKHISFIGSMRPLSPSIKCSDKVTTKLQRIPGGLAGVSEVQKNIFNVKTFLINVSGYPISLGRLSEHNGMNKWPKI